MTDLSLGLRTDDDGDPSRLRALLRRGDDLDAIAIIELMAQRDVLAIDLTRYSPCTYTTMDHEGKVKEGRPLRELEDLTLGGEDVDLPSLEGEERGL